MEKSRRASFVVVVVFLASLIVHRAIGSSTIELNIEIAEELPVGTVVADLAAGAGGVDVQGGGDDAPEFAIFSGNFSRYFRVGVDSERTTSSRTAGHLLIVDRILDRDVICDHE